jgi:glucose/arabinose dehydrogenase
MNLKFMLVLFVCLLVFTCFLTLLIFWTPLTSAQNQNEGVEVAFPNLAFSQPVGIINSGDGKNRLFVVEQSGIIKVFENLKNATVSHVFLDISDRVLFGGEQGLLGTAFHPNYEENGYFYVDYVTANPLRTVVSRYSVNPSNPDQSDKDSEFIILEIDQPFSNHNGGQLAFGADGFLYVGLGDGGSGVGSGGDPYGNAQNKSSLLGKILRIDVNSPSEGKNYSIPADNPFTGNTLGYREEIYANGFRNPWRFSFDSVTGELWVGDVGQNEREEIDVVEKGDNCGWKVMEGTLCYSPPSGCNQTGLKLPVWEYSHDQGNAIIGGYVYHATKLTDFDGAYFYGDYGTGKIWALWYNATGNSTNILLADMTTSIASFGVDESGEIYFAGVDGIIYTFNAAIIPEYSLYAICAILLVITLVGALVLRVKNHFSSLLRKAQHNL